MVRDPGGESDEQAERRKGAVAAIVGRRLTALFVGYPLDIHVSWD